MGAIRKIHLFRFLIMLLILLAISDCPNAFAAGSFSNYMPLQVGNTWEYKTINIRNGDERNIKISITREEIDPKRGMTSYYYDKKVIYYKTSKGIMTYSREMLLQDPIKPGETWASGENIAYQTVHLIEDVDINYMFNGKLLKDCIKVKSTSPFHATPRDDNKVFYIASEADTIYCRDLGKVFIETYDIFRETGEKVKVSTTQLVTFKREQDEIISEVGSMHETKNKANDAISVYMPLKLGNAWIYKVTKNKKLREDEISIEKTTIGHVTDNNYYDERGTLLYTKDNGRLYSSQNILLLKGPIEKGTTWQTGNNFNYTSVIDDVGLSLSVAGQLYKDCIRVSSRSSSAIKTSVYCQNIGRVYRDSHILNNDGSKELVYKDELISFEQKGKVLYKVK